MKRMKVVVAATLIASIIFGGNFYTAAKTVKKTEISTKKVIMKIGQKKAIKLKKEKKKAKYTFKSSKTGIVKVSKQGVMTAIKAGRAKITVKEKLDGKVKKIGTVTVTVKKATDSGTQPEPVQTATPAPMQTEQPQPTGTSEPPKATESPEPTGDSQIKDTPSKFTSVQSGVRYGTVKKEQYYSTTTERKRNVIVILPNGYTEEKKYPVLYLFHGGMGDENDWISGGVKNMIGNMIASGEAKEMILVLPNCRCREDDSVANADGFALGHVQSFDNFLNDFKDNLMPYIESNYSVAAGRENTAIAGLSMGGRVALNIGISLPEKVGYTGAFSPAYGIFPYTNMGLTEEGLFTEKTFTLPDEYKDNTFIMINNGNQDNMVKDEPKRYHNALDANGVKHIYYTLDGMHDWKVWRNGFYNYARYLF
ncbi:MAG: alpha/beta hydrolase-fold protein [Eubacterium sp.]|nr:alpha/beta hydrolase-fold protein [Eubacterium sp.]